MYKKLVLLTATVLLGFTWGCARPGDIGPMGPSGTPGTQGQPGMDLIGWHQVLGSYFDTDAMGTLPAAYQVVAPYPTPRRWLI